MYVCVVYVCVQREYVCVCESVVCVCKYVVCLRERGTERETSLLFSLIYP